MNFQVLSILLATVIITSYIYVSRDTEKETSKFLIILPMASIMLSFYTFFVILPDVIETEQIIENFLNGGNTQS